MDQGARTGTNGIEMEPDGNQRDQNGTDDSNRGAKGIEIEPDDDSKWNRRETIIKLEHKLNAVQIQSLHNYCPHILNIMLHAIRTYGAGADGADGPGLSVSKKWTVLGAGECTPQVCTAAPPTS